MWSTLSCNIFKLKLNKIKLSEVIFVATLFGWKFAQYFVLNRFILRFFYSLQKFLILIAWTWVFFRALYFLCLQKKLKRLKIESCKIFRVRQLEKRSKNRNLINEMIKSINCIENCSIFGNKKWYFQDTYSKSRFELQVLKLMFLCSCIMIKRKILIILKPYIAQHKLNFLMKIFMFIFPPISMLRWWTCCGENMLRCSFMRGQLDIF